MIKMGAVKNRRPFSIPASYCDGSGSKVKGGRGGMALPGKETLGDVGKVSKHVGTQNE